MSRKSDAIQHNQLAKVQRSIKVYKHDKKVMSFVNTVLDAMVKAEEANIRNTPL